MEERKALEDSIQRMEQAQPTEVITTKVKNDEIDQTGKSYLDETKQILHISLEKRKKRDSKILVELQTATPAFPFLATQSNIEWREHAQLN